VCPAALINQQVDAAFSLQTRRLISTWFFQGAELREDEIAQQAVLLEHVTFALCLHTCQIYTYIYTICKTAQAAGCVVTSDLIACAPPRWRIFQRSTAQPPHPAPCETHTPSA
jgi:hypothetical protein